MADSDNLGLRHLMPGIFSGLATALTAAAGLVGVLHETGYLGSRASATPPVAAQVRASTQVPEPARQLASAETRPALVQPPSAAPIRTSPIPARNPKNLSGAWRDGASNCHLIKQAGHELTVSSYVAATGQLRAVGGGTIKGRIISMRMNSRNPASPEADLILSDDGRELSGMVKWPKGAHVARWRFVGPSCS
jgi:hypothetical protein